MRGRAHGRCRGGTRHHLPVSGDRGGGVATTDDPRKGFTDRGIICEWGSEAIDGFVFKDDEGKPYFSWKAYGLDRFHSSADGKEWKAVGEHEIDGAFEFMQRAGQERIRAGDREAQAGV